MRKVRFAIIFVVVAASFGIPAQVSALPSIPKSVNASVRLASGLSAGSSKTFQVPLPWRANMVGLSFTTPAHSQKGVSLAVRAHTSDGWSAWEAVDQGDIGPDPGGAEAKHAGARVATEALWVGTADKIDVRAAVASGARAIHDLRIFLTNTMGDAKPQNVASRALHALGSFLSARADWQQHAEAATRQPTIIMRSQWGPNPRYLNLPCPGIASTLKMAFVHHTDTPNSYSKSQSASIVRAIYNYHTNSLGYCDIAYNFLVDRYGQIFEGRMGGITRNVIAAHTLGFNTNTVGVALIGTFTSAHPTSAMLGSLDRLLAWRMDIAHIPAIGKVAMKYGASVKWKKGTIVWLNRISGHRDGYPTACPGAKVYYDLPWVRRHVQAIGLPKIYVPTASTVVLRPDGDATNESVRVAATFSTTANWTLSYADAHGVTHATFTGTGTSMGQTWNGKRTDGTYAPTGYYHWTLSAVDLNGHPATPANSYLYVVTDHPGGTLLNDTTGKYVIASGAAQAVDGTSYTSTFGTTPAVATGPGERARYASGAAFGLRQGTLLVGPTGAHYIWSDGALRLFKIGNGQNGTDPYQTLGYQSAAALPVSVDYLAALPSGPDVTDQTLVHPDGSLVRTVDPVTKVSSYYVMDNGSRRPISTLARGSWYRSAEVVTANAFDLATATGTAFPVRDGTFIKATDGGAPWLIVDGKKSRFYNAALASVMGYTSTMLRIASSADLNAIPTGARIG